MGKATVTSHDGDGLYTVNILYDTTRVDAEIANLTIAVNELIYSKIPAAIAAEASAEVSVSTAETQLNFQIAQYNLGLIAKQEVIDAQTDLLSASATLGDARTHRRLEELRKVSINKRIAFLNANKKVSESRQVWCADYTTTLSGDVGTIEVNGESSEILIQPDDAATRDAAYTVARDGQLVQSIAQTPEQVYYNWAVRPGAQRHKPTYRVGTISNINTALNTCDVALASALAVDRPIHPVYLGSSGTFPDINIESSLTSVPVEYSLCNAAAFTSGDEVIVEFTGYDWAAPKVIGFRDNPQRCEYRFKVYDANGALVTPDSVIEFWTANTTHNIPAPTSHQTNEFFIDFALWQDLGGGTYSKVGNRYMDRHGTTLVKTYNQLSYDATTSEWVFLGAASSDLLIEVRVKEHIWTVYPDKINRIANAKFATGTPIKAGAYTINLEAFHTSDSAGQPHVSNTFELRSSQQVVTTQNYWSEHHVRINSVTCVNDEDSKWDDVTYSNSHGTISVTRSFDLGESYACIADGVGGSPVRTATGLGGAIEWLKALGNPVAGPPPSDTPVQISTFCDYCDPSGIQGGTDTQPFHATRNRSV